MLCVRKQGEHGLHAAAGQLRELGLERGGIVEQDKVRASLAVRIGEILGAQLAGEKGLRSGAAEQGFALGVRL